MLVAVARVVSRVRDRSFGDALAVVSAPVGVVVAATAMYVASQRTMTIADGTSRDWPWLPGGSPAWAWCSAWPG